MSRFRFALALLTVTLSTACTLDDGPTAPPDPTTASSQVGPDAQLARSAQAQGFVPGRVLVRFRAGADVAGLVQAQGASVQRLLALGTRLLAVPAGQEQAVAAALSRSPLVEFAEPDYFYTVEVPCGTGSCQPPTDGFFGYRWDLYNDGTITDGQGVDLAPTGAVDADMDWLEAFDAMGPIPGSAIIGIIDTGILSSHEDLVGKVVAGYDFFAMDPDPADDNGHGTHVAGIAAAHGNNGIGVPGVAWVSQVQIASAKVCGYLYGFLYGCPSSAIADGIQWAVDNGADVLNLSLGGASGSSAVQNALQYARQNGVLPFCAAGNDGGAVGYPAAFPECVAVSATNWSDGLASYSNFGPQVELAAPGGDFESPDSYSFILSAYGSGNNAYAWLAGTSMATPQAAGLGGLLHALGVTDPDAKLARMRATANDLGAPGDDVLFGAGRINIYTAVADLIGAPPNQLPNASFSANCTDLTCDFTDTSTDGEGSVVGWAWDFGDGATSTVRNPAHTFAVAGTYTVTLTATDDQGASASFSRDLTVPIPNVPPTASFTSSCNGFTCDFTDTSTDPDGTLVAWAWDFGDGGTSTAQNPSHTYAAAGTYTVTLVATDDDAEADTVSATVGAAPPNAPPTASFTSSCAALVCDFTSTSTDSDGTIKSHEWNFGDGWSSNGPNPSHTYFNPGTFTVTLIVRDDDNAADTTSADVVATLPGEAPTASFTVSCTDLTCDFTDTSTDSQGSVVAWSWDFGDGTTSTAQSPSHAYAVAGTYTVTLTATDDVGATDTASRDVTVPSANQGPTAAFTSSCIDLACTFTDTSADGDGTVVAWSWDFGDGATSTVQNPTHDFPGPGTYTVTLTATDDDGASDTFAADLTVTVPNVAPTASFTWDCTDQKQCAFASTSTDSDGTIVDHQWSFGDGWSSNGPNPSHTYFDYGVYTVTLTVTDNDGATDSFSTDVTVAAPGQAPTASFSLSCVDLTCDFADASTAGANPIVSWAWDFGDGTTSAAQNPTHTFAAAGTYAVTLTVTDGGGLSDPATTNVTVPTVNQAPVASFTSSCTDLACSFTDASTDADGTVVSWAWDFGDGATSTVQNPSHAYAAEATYTVTLTVTDDAGGTGTVSANVTAKEPNNPPTASFTWSCSGLTCDFTDTSTDGDGSVQSRSWSFGDGWSSNGATPSHTYQTADTFTVALTVTDNDGAQDTYSTDIVVGQAPVASFTWSCPGLTCDFTDTSTDGDGTLVFWSWTFGDGATSFAQNPTHTYAAAGTYTVTLTVDDNDGVSDTFTAAVTVTASNPNLAPAASFTSSCTDLSCVFTDTSTDSDGSVVSWSWNFGDGAMSAAQNPGHAYGAAGSYTVTLTVTDDGGLTDTFSAGVTVAAPNQAPTASFTSNCTDLSCAFTDTSTDGDGSVVSWAWDFGDGAVSAAQNPSHAYGAAGGYTVTLTVTDDGGASATYSATVTVSAPPVVITLTAVGYKVRRRHTVDLTWSGATTPQVDIYRDGALILTTANDGAETDAMRSRGKATYAYQVCEAGTSTCSQVVTVTF